MEQYKLRIADELLKRRLMGKGAVLVEGPKWCGKTTTAYRRPDGVYVAHIGCLKD